MVLHVLALAVAPISLVLGLAGGLGGLVARQFGLPVARRQRCGPPCRPLGLTVEALAVIIVLAASALTPRARSLSSTEPPGPRGSASGPARSGTSVRRYVGSSLLLSPPLVARIADLVVSHCCSHHLDAAGKARALAEAHRVLRPDHAAIAGLLIVFLLIAPVGVIIWLQG